MAHCPVTAPAVLPLGGVTALLLAERARPAWWFCQRPWRPSESRSDFPKPTVGMGKNMLLIPSMPPIIFAASNAKDLLHRVKK